MAGITGVNFCGTIQTRSADVVLAEAGKVGDVIKRQLRKRLTRLNVSTAPEKAVTGHRQRFGKDGIKSILKRIKTRKDAIIANGMLDDLEKGKSVWTYDICKKLDPEYGTPSWGIRQLPHDIFIRK